MEGGIAILDREALKAKFLGCFAARTTSAQTLPEVVKILLQLGVVRTTLFWWGIAAGHSHATVRSLLSRAFCALGLRQRRSGAGRKPSAEALKLLAHSRQQYGIRALRMLRAAYRAGKAQDAAHAAAANPTDSVPELIVAPQLLISRPIVEPQLDSAKEKLSVPATNSTETLRDYPNESNDYENRLSED